MLSRSTTILSSIVALVAFSACSNRYSDVYSFKKNSFKAPAPKTKAEVPPAAATNVNPLQIPPAGVPGTNQPAGIPGVPGSAPADIPGVPGVPAAPAAPAAIPGLP